MNGSKITVDAKGVLNVPNDPIIPFIEGDGTGPDIWRASVHVFDEAVKKAYGGKRKVHWREVLAGDKAFKATGNYLPDETVAVIKEHRVAIKGPLETPVGKGIRSLNVALRQIMDLYQCVRPVRYVPGVPSPMKEPEKLNIVLFRENTEDVYAGHEWQQGTPEAAKVIAFLNTEMKRKIREDSGIGIKPISVFGSKRIVRAAIAYAIKYKRSSVTIVHKGNIMKFTEGAFRDWGYEVAKTEFADRCITEDDVFKHHNGKPPAGKIVVKDRIADSTFQQLLLRPDEYDVLVTTNLNGDYISDAAAAQVGGLGIAPGGNIGDGYAVFEATHGTAPKYAGQDKVNPGSVILSGQMMFEYMGWSEVAALIEKGLAKAVADKQVTYDFERQMTGAKLLKCSEFGKAIAARF